MDIALILWDWLSHRPMPCHLHCVQQQRKKSLHVVPVLQERIMKNKTKQQQQKKHIFLKEKGFKINAQKLDLVV